MRNKMLQLVMFFLIGVAAFTVYAQEDTASEMGELTKNTPRKSVGEATINIQTTVTGNQEQPRVLYILPWQSPLSPELDIEMFDSQQESVFGHVEREELLRGLESAGELDALDE